MTLAEKYGIGKRDIKFRAWSSPNMIYGIENEVNEPDCLEEAFAYYLPQYENGYIVMQYTGLKDKNAKEIYEGDIIEFKFFHEEKDYIVVGQNNESFISLQLNILRDPIVVGNIFENPEMIELIEKND